MSLGNIAANMLRPGYFSVMAGKLWLRLVDPNRPKGTEEAARWCRAVAEDKERFAAGLDGDLWAESRRFGDEFQRTAEAKMAALGVDLGGGGDYALVYFLTRLLKPQSVVETGVAAGFTAQAVLTAMARNGTGQLYSSDFPYFRLKNPEQYVGYLVDDELKDRWEVYLRGERDNLPLICRRAKRIGLVHYDSDKTKAGRAFAMDLLAPRLTRDGVFVMDDIQDNLFFRDYAESRDCKFRVFALNDRYLGLIGL